MIVAQRRLQKRLVPIQLQPLTLRRERSTSCGAAVRVKPKARLCEPWLMVRSDLGAVEAATRIPNGSDLTDSCRPSGLARLRGVDPRLAKPPWAEF